MEGVAAAIDDRILYLYGFVPHPLALPPIEPIEPDAPVFLVASGGLACAASLVAAHAWQRSDAQDPAERAAWVTERALRHHQAVMALHAAGPVLPLKFGTVCRSAGDARLLLDDLRELLAPVLETFRNKDEWTLRMSMDIASITARCEAESPALRALKEAEATLPEGRAYFARKQRAKASADFVDAAVAAVEDAVLERLAGAAAIARSARTAGGGRQDAAPAALLVDRAERETIDAVLAALQSEHAGCGLAFELVGPWPPYSFAPALATR